MDSCTLYSILLGAANDPCSIPDFVTHMPAGGSQCRHFSRRPEEQRQLRVFWYPGGAGASNSPVQKVASFLESLEEYPDWSKYMGIINLVQFWALVTTGDGETAPSVWEQPFGMGGLTNGVFRYRSDCIRNPWCDAGDPISRAFATGQPQVQFSELPVSEQYGVQSVWVLPLLEPPTGSPFGVVEFVSTTVPSVEIHGLFTQSFLEHGSKYYEIFSHNMNMVGTGFRNGHPLSNSRDHVPTHQLITDDQTIWDGLEDIEQIPQENFGGTCHDHQIEETSGMVQQLRLEPANAAPPATSRKGKRVTMTCNQLRRYFGRRQKDVADEIGVSVSTIKRWCRSCGIQKWPSHNRESKAAKNKMGVQAKYGTCIVKFKIDSSIGFECFCNKLGERFELRVGSFRIEYEDEHGDLIMIPCAEDLKARLDFLNSSNTKTMHLIVSRAN